MNPSQGYFALNDAQSFPLSSNNCCRLPSLPICHCCCRSMSQVAITCWNSSELAGIQDATSSTISHNALQIFQRGMNLRDGPCKSTENYYPFPSQTSPSIPNALLPTYSVDHAGFREESSINYSEYPENCTNNQLPYGIASPQVPPQPIRASRYPPYIVPKPSNTVPSGPSIGAPEMHGTPIEFG